MGGVRMKIDLCCYSGYKIYPGHGRTLVKGDGKSYKFLSSRTHKAHMLKRNPRKITWTVLYRRKHKKGLEEDVTKKRTRRAQKFQRAVVGATLQDIMAKRNQKPEVKSPERAGCARRQGPEEGHRQEARCQGQGRAEGPEGNKERSQGRTRQGWRQAINILL